MKETRDSNGSSLARNCLPVWESSGSHLTRAFYSLHILDPKRVHKPATADESKDPSQRLGAYGGLGDLFSVRFLRYSPLSSFR